MSTALYTHPDCEQHDIPGHPERPDRLRAVMNRLTASGLLQDAEQHLAKELDASSLTLVHPGDYVNHVIESSPENGMTKLDPDTFMSPGSLRASRLAAGACLAATRDVLEGIHTRAFCAIRPPGHHAELAAAMGFCIFNNVAIAAEYALQQPEVERVAIVDFDVHHCNGTVDIFKDRDAVLVCSSFQDNYYPHRYLDFENGHIVNTPLAAGSDGNDFRRVVSDRWLPALAAHRPDLILISAGFDAHRQDPLADLRFETEDYRWITETLGDVADDVCGGRLVSTLEGGYDLDALSGGVEAHFGALLQR